MQLRHALDDALLHLVAELDLDHLAGQVLTDLLDLLDAELQQFPTPFDQDLEQQRREVTGLFVVGLLAKV